MTTAEEAVKDPNLLPKYIDENLAAALVKEFGYSWPSERVERIARGAADLISDGFPADFSFAEAFNDELAMYGDGSDDKVVGLISQNRVV